MPSQEQRLHGCASVTHETAVDKLRTRRPPTLIVWGQDDAIFPADGARPYLRDLPEAELHLLDTGHFALEDKGDEIGALMHEFLGRKLRGPSSHR